MIFRIALSVSLFALAACDAGASLVDAGDAEAADAPIDGPHDTGIDAPDLAIGACGLDEDGDSIPSAVEGTRDTDGDGLSDAQDPDADGDGAPDYWESGRLDCALAPVDTDGDGAPDYLDVDSDDDTILDAAEWNPGNPDQDADLVDNSRDLDSDGDGAPDAIEAGDALVATAPVSCAHEWNPSTRTFFYPSAPGTTPVPYAGDSIPDYLDVDSDNDSLLDGDERRLGLDPCNPDSDGDGFDDAVEGSYTDYACPDGTTPIPGAPAGACTLGRGGGPLPSDVLVAVLPYEGAAQRFPMSFDTAALAGSPPDVDTALRGEPNPLHVDTTRFIKRRTPACNDAVPPDTSCWAEPAGTTHDAAVSMFDTSAFFGVVPGTRLTFDVTLRNDFFRGDIGSDVFVAFLDARGAGSAVLDSRLFIVVVPPTPTYF